jgi:hypothetical protein
LLYSTNDGFQNILEYTDDAEWDPVSEQFLFVGCGHYATWHFIGYSAKSNSWREVNNIAWSGIGHAYDHSAVNPKGRLFYHRPYGSTTVYKYDIDANSWSSLPQISSSVMEYNDCCVALDYFPEMHSLLYFSLESGANGSLIRFNETTNQWVRVGPGKNLPCGNYQMFSEYNPVHKVFWFGGGGSSTANYKVDSLGTITTLNPAPMALGIMNTIITVDPVSGLYLVFTMAGEFYTFDIMTGAWTQQNGTVPIFNPHTNGGPIWCTVATPVSTYGVTMFLKFYYSSPSQAWAYIYKHSSGTGTETVPGVRTAAELQVFPNPARLGMPVQLALNAVHSEPVIISAYDLDGRLLTHGTAAFSATGKAITWNPPTVGAGIILVKVTTGNATYCKRVLMIR